MFSYNHSTQSDSLLVGSTIVSPEPLIPEVEHVHSHKLGTAHAYACWDRERGFDWCAVGGQSTSHSEALRTITGSEHVVHPTLGWDDADLELQAGCVLTTMGDAHAVARRHCERARYGAADVSRLELCIAGKRAGQRQLCQFDKE